MNTAIPIVLKFGSSVVAGHGDIPSVVHEIYRYRREGRPVVAVVSAHGDTTDRLDELARRIHPHPGGPAYADLLATGEMKAVAALLLALDAAGIPAAGLDHKHLDLRTSGPSADAVPASVDAALLRSALAGAGVAVVPGFLGVDNAGTTLLGRGGSDLTALFIARALDAECRLLKDVDGWFEADPSIPGCTPRRFETISFEDAIAHGAPIVQPKAVAWARGARQPFAVASLNSPAESRVGEEPTRLRAAGAAAPALRILLAGLGTVGLSAYRLLRGFGERVEVARILIRRASLPRPADVDRTLLSDCPSAFLRQPADVLIDASGDPAVSLDIAARALARGISVVTASKPLVARSGPRLAALGRKHGARLLFGAAVGGSVPMAEAVRLLAPRGIARLRGVLNGTTNFVLEGIRSGESAAAALARARELGLSEGDGETDLSGRDAADKLTILARIAFGGDPPAPSIAGPLPATFPAPGMRNRQVAAATRTGDGVDLRVEFEALAAEDPLHDLAGAGNALLIEYGDGGRRLLRGTGAGGRPTAEAIMGDLLQLLRERAAEGKAVAP